jgi:hypothetical protein
VKKKSELNKDYQNKIEQVGTNDENVETKEEIVEDSPLVEKEKPIEDKKNNEKVEIQFMEEK